MFFLDKAIRFNSLLIVNIETRASNSSATYTTSSSRYRLGQIRRYSRTASQMRGVKDRRRLGGLRGTVVLPYLSGFERWRPREFRLHFTAPSMAALQNPSPIIPRLKSCFHLGRLGAIAPSGRSRREPSRCNGEDDNHVILSSRSFCKLRRWLGSDKADLTPYETLGNCSARHR